MVSNVSPRRSTRVTANRDSVEPNKTPKSSVPNGRSANRKKKTTSSEDGVYEVESIIGHRKDGDDIVYTVTWVGYGSDENTELCESDLEGAPYLLKAYRKKHKLDDSSSDSAVKQTTSRQSRVVRISSSPSFNEDEESDAMPPIIRSARNADNERSSSTSSVGIIEHTLSNPGPSTRATRNTAANKRSLDTRSENNENYTKRARQCRMKLAPNWIDDNVSDNGTSSTSAADNAAEDKIVSISLPKNIGLFNGLEVSRIASLKSGAKKSVKVYYKEPIPAPFKAYDEIETRFVRYYAPQKLIDLYEQLVSQ